MNITMLKVLAGDGYGERGVYEHAAKTAEELILNYCNIDEIPPGLERTALDLAVDLLRLRQPGTSGALPAAVTSIEVGDTKTSFASLFGAKSETELLAAYAKTLNRYRRVLF